MDTVRPTPGGVGQRARIINELRVHPDRKADLAQRDTRWTGGGEFEQLSATDLDATAKALLARGTEQLADAQELLWASDTYSLLIVSDPTTPPDTASATHNTLEA